MAGIASFSDFLQGFIDYETFGCAPLATVFSGLFQ
jgi:hypothetical protein